MMSLMPLDPQVVQLARKDDILNNRHGEYKGSKGNVSRSRVGRYIFNSSACVHGILDAMP